MNYALLENFLSNGYPLLEGLAKLRNPAGRADERTNSAVGGEKDEGAEEGRRGFLEFDVEEGQEGDDGGATVAGAGGADGAGGRC